MDGALITEVGVPEDICALFITVGLGVDGLGDAMEDVVCPEKADGGAAMLIAEKVGVVGVEGWFRALAGEAGVAPGVADGVGGADVLVPCGERCGVAGA